MKVLKNPHNSNNFQSQCHEIPVQNCSKLSFNLSQLHLLALANITLLSTGIIV